jgi:hypothetical protein
MSDETGASSTRCGALGLRHRCANPDTGAHRVVSPTCRSAVLVAYAVHTAMVTGVNVAAGGLVSTSAVNNILGPSARAVVRLNSWAAQRAEHEW